MEKLLKTSNFSFCHNVFHFYSQVVHSIIEIFFFLTKYVQSRLLQNCWMREKVKGLDKDLFTFQLIQRPQKRNITMPQPPTLYRNFCSKNGAKYHPRNEQSNRVVAQGSLREVVVQVLKRYLSFFKIITLAHIQQICSR